MSYKHMPRLGSAIASTILSLFSGVLLVGVDKAQAAVLSYNFEVGGGGGSGFFKVDNSSVRGIDFEGIAISEGRLNTELTASSDRYPLKGKDYYNLAGAIALFYQGEFRGLQASGFDTAITEINISADEPYGPYYVRYEGMASWQMDNNGPVSLFWGYKEVYIISSSSPPLVDRGFDRVDAGVSYTLVDTEPEPVPEPLTTGGTALALAGLSWLKQKKKMAA
ncbi:PEP-CTERM sorting domain-containing protein [Microcoleus sp. AR_TQ3_B6]|uniref:PEP-CTERM sorting domain-containing protein n=1 Tax=Microcoleus sp. AR_TQ3_B6 TaxID=3055284 RepID=UPI002FD1A995